jgi:hypothetical protein
LKRDIVDKKKRREGEATTKAQGLGEWTTGLSGECQPGSTAGETRFFHKAPKAQSQWTELV